MQTWQPMIAVAAAVLFAWAALFATAYVVRYRLGASAASSLVAVATCYLALAAMAVLVVGIDLRGALAATGMLVPATAAAGWVIARRAFGSQR